MTVHDFHESLQRSHEYEDAPWWEEVYRQAFPSLVAMPSMRTDGWAQRGGIDRMLVLGDGTTLTVDEKVRERDYPDFCLEYWSDCKRRVPGWIAKDLTCDYIAYAFVPSRTCYLLPFQLLRASWRENHEAWVRTYQKVEAMNRGYVTVSVAVPIDVVMAALVDAMTVRWTAAASDRDTRPPPSAEEEPGYWESRFEEGLFE